MSEETSTEQQPRTPSYIRYATISGFIAFALTIIFACYVAAVFAGWAPRPVIGVVSTWMALITMCTAVKLCQVMATAAAQPTEQQVALLRAELREAMVKVGGDALREARKAGEWKGTAQTLRDVREGALDSEATGDVVPFGPRRRPGS